MQIGADRCRGSVQRRDGAEANMPARRLYLRRLYPAWYIPREYVTMYRMDIYDAWAGVAGT